MKSVLLRRSRRRWLHVGPEVDLRCDDLSRKVCLQINDISAELLTAFEVLLQKCPRANPKARRRIAALMVVTRVLLDAQGHAQAFEAPIFAYHRGLFGECCLDFRALSRKLTATIAQRGGQEARKALFCFCALTDAAHLLGMPRSLTQRMKAELHDSVNLTGQECFICLEGFGQDDSDRDALVARCGHCVHHDCFCHMIFSRAWGSGRGQVLKGTCGVCRAPFRWPNALRARQWVVATSIMVSEVERYGADEPVRTSIRQLCQTAQEAGTHEISLELPGAAASLQVFGKFLGLGKMLAIHCTMVAIEVEGDPGLRHNVWSAVLAKAAAQGVDVPNSLQGMTLHFLEEEMLAETL